MNFTEIAKHRISNQQLADTDIKSAVEMVEWFGAVQGQEYSQTKWGLGLRLPFLKDAHVEKELNEGKILRTHLLRPTWHFVSARDIRWLLELTASRVQSLNAYMYRKLELSNKVFNRCNDILVSTLEGGKQLTRKDINENFRKHKIIAKGHRLSYIMMNAELSGIICDGTRQGNKFTYALLDERVGKTKTLHREEALVELTKRYFLSRGPATTKDFSTWSGLTMPDSKKGIEMVKSLFNREVIKGQEYFFPSGISLTKSQLEKVYLLPVYDEFIMGYKDRSSIKIFASNKPTSLPQYTNMIIFEGQIIGSWKRSITQKSIDVAIRLFAPLDEVQTRLLDNAVRRLGEFTDMTVNYVK